VSERRVAAAQGVLLGGAARRPSCVLPAMSPGDGCHEASLVVPVSSNLHPQSPRASPSGRRFSAVVQEGVLVMRLASPSVPTTYS